MKEAFFRAIQKQVLLYTSEFSIEDPTNVFWLVVYGIVTLLLKKLMILAFWVIEINVKDLEVCITEGTDEPIQHSLSLRIDSFSFHRFQDVSDSWKQLTVSSLSVSYASSLIQSPFLLAHFQNALSLRVHISCQSRVDRIKCTLPKQSSNHPHSISLLHSPRAFSIEFRSLLSPTPPSFESPVWIYPDPSSPPSLPPRSGLFRSWLQSMRSFRWFLVVDFPGLVVSSFNCSLQHLHLQGGLQIDTIAGLSLSESIEISANLSLFGSCTVPRRFECSLVSFGFDFASVRRVHHLHTARSLDRSGGNRADQRVDAVSIVTTRLTRLHREPSSSSLRTRVQTNASSSLRTAALPKSDECSPIASNSPSSRGSVSSRRAKRPSFAVTNRRSAL